MLGLFRVGQEMDYLLTYFTSFYIYLVILSVVNTVSSQYCQ
jgi:hypothetical protein